MEEVLYNEFAGEWNDKHKNEMKNVLYQLLFVRFNSGPKYRKEILEKIFKVDNYSGIIEEKEIKKLTLAERLAEYKKRKTETTDLN